MISPNGDKPGVIGDGWSLTFPEGFVLNDVAYHFPYVENGVTIYPGTGSWSVDGNVLKHSRVYTNPDLHVETTVAQLGNDVELTLAIRNLSGFDWDGWSMANICYKPVMQDPSWGGLTHAFKDGAYPTIGSMVAIPQSGPMIGQYGLHVQRPAAEPNNVDGPMIIRRNPASTNFTAITFHDASVIGGNMNQGSCMHSDAKIGTLANGQARSLKGRIVIGATSWADVYSRLGVV